MEAFLPPRPLPPRVVRQDALRSLRQGPGPRGLRPAREHLPRHYRAPPRPRGTGTEPGRGVRRPSLIQAISRFTIVGRVRPPGFAPCRQMGIAVVSHRRCARHARDGPPAQARRPNGHDGDRPACLRLAGRERAVRADPQEDHAVRGAAEGGLPGGRGAVRHPDRQPADRGQPDRRRSRPAHTAEGYLAGRAGPWTRWPAEVEVDLVGGFSAMVQKGWTEGDRTADRRRCRKSSRPRKRVCASVNVGTTAAGINMDAILAKLGRVLVETPPSGRGITTGSAAPSSSSSPTPRRTTRSWRGRSTARASRIA